MLGLHGGRAENGELQAMCELRGIPFTGSGSASSNLAFDKVAAKRFAAIAGVTAPAGIALEDIERGLRRVWQADRKTGEGRLELWADLRQRETGPRRGPQRRENRRICHRAVHCGRGGDLRRAGAAGWRGVRRCRRSRSSRREGGFDYTAKYLLKSTQEICPGRFSPEISAALMDQALRAHRALSCTRLFPHRFHRVGEGADLPRDQHPAGPDHGLALPEGAEGAGHRIRRFPARPDRARPASAPTGSGTRGNAAGGGRIGHPLVDKFLTNARQSIHWAIKTRLSRIGFTLCLPGSPKVNAGGACGAWLPGREQLRISASTIATREQGPLLP